MSKQAPGRSQQRIRQVIFGQAQSQKRKWGRGIEQGGALRHDAMSGVEQRQTNCEGRNGILWSQWGWRNVPIGSRVWSFHRFQSSAHNCIANTEVATERCRWTRLLCLWVVLWITGAVDGMSTPIWVLSPQPTGRYGAGEGQKSWLWKGPAKWKGVDSASLPDNVLAASPSYQWSSGISRVAVCSLFAGLVGGKVAKSCAAEGLNDYSSDLEVCELNWCKWGSNTESLINPIPKYVPNVLEYITKVWQPLNRNTSLISSLGTL